MTKFIGFSGKIGTGKTTVCRLIQQELAERGKFCAIVPFGLGLKEHTASTFNVPFGWFFTEEGKEQEITLTQKSFPVYTTHEGTIDGFSYLHEIHHAVTPHFPDNKITVRKLLQWWATEVCRSLDPDFWVKQWELKVNETRSTQNVDVILCDDIRFPENEMPVFINNYGGVVYRILPYPGWDRHSNHYSETALDSYEFEHHLKPEGFGLQYLQAAARRVIRNEGLLEE